jgi:hypothetical protein
MTKKRLLEVLASLPDDAEVSFAWRSIKRVCFDEQSKTIILSSTEVSDQAAGASLLGSCPTLFNKGKIIYQKAIA